MEWVELRGCCFLGSPPLLLRRWFTRVFRFGVFPRTSPLPFGSRLIVIFLLLRRSSSLLESGCRGSGGSSGRGCGGLQDRRFIPAALRATSSPLLGSLSILRCIVSLTWLLIKLVQILPLSRILLCLVDCRRHGDLDAMERLSFARPRYDWFEEESNQAGEIRECGF